MISVLKRRKRAKKSQQVHVINLGAAVHDHDKACCFRFSGSLLVNDPLLHPDEPGADTNGT